MQNTQIVETKMDHAKQTLHHAASYLACAGSNDSKKLDDVYRLIWQAIDLINEAKQDEAA